MARRNPKIITFRQNPIRWVIFVVLTGLIASLLLAFVEESLFPLPVPFFYKSLWVLGGAPAGFLILALWVQRSLERRRMIRIIKAIIERHRQFILGFFLFLVWAAGYFLIARYTDYAEARVIETRLDRPIPFRPEFVFIYLTIYSVYLLPFFLVKDVRFFNIIAWAYITVMLICYATFLVYPVRIERPAFVVNSFSTWALEKVYRYDSPVNCMPSMHAAMAMISSLTLYELSRRGGALAILLTVTIGASTLFIKQHYVADIFAGFILALVVFHLYFRGKVLDVLRAEALRLESAIGEAVNARIDERLKVYLDQELERRIEEIVERKVQKLTRGGGRGL